MAPRRRAASDLARAAAEAPAEAPAPNLENLVAVRIVRLAELIARMAARQFEPTFGLRNTDLRILNLLDGTEGISVSEISRRAHVDKAWISRSLRELGAKGLVTRREDRADTRLSVVSLTAEGKRLLDQVRPIAVANEAVLLEGIDAPAFLTSLDRLMRNAEAAYGAQPRRPGRA